MFPAWDAAKAAMSGVDSLSAHADKNQPAAIKVYYTNGELYDLLRPEETDLPYVYDNFAWPHCSVSSGLLLAVCFVGGGANVWCRCAAS